MLTTTTSTHARGSDRSTAVLVGVLFLTSTATFAIGSNLIASYFSGEGAATSTLVIGVLLQVYTGLAVAGIGLAMLPILSHRWPALARAYLALRCLECLAIMALGAFMLATRSELQHDNLLIYSFTAIGGIVFAYLLYVSRLIPRTLAVFGLIGYVALSLGVLAALLGIANLNAGWGMAFFAPGGLFELILPLWLFVKGFQQTGVAHP